jgi:hypothetical protein
MTPEDLSKRLRSLADRVDSSQSPSVSKTSAELKRLALELDESGSSLPVPHATPGFVRNVAPASHPETNVLDEVSFRSAMDDASAHYVPDYGFTSQGSDLPVTRALPAERLQSGVLRK